MVGKLLINNIRNIAQQRLCRDMGLGGMTRTGKS